MKRLSWKPQRNGKIYCAPACGGRCTWEAHKAAQVAAQKLAEHLNDILPEGKWKPRVHENLGWHWHVQSKDKRMKVYKNNWDDGYHAMYSPEKGIGGRMAWKSEDDFTPYGAVKKAAEAAYEEIRYLADSVGIKLEGKGKYLK